MDQALELWIEHQHSQHLIIAEEGRHDLSAQSKTNTRQQFLMVLDHCFGCVGDRLSDALEVLDRNALRKQALQDLPDDAGLDTIAQIIHQLWLCLGELT